MAVKRSSASTSDPLPPLLFEAALPLGTAFTLTGEGDAILKLAVPQQFAKILSDHIHLLMNTSFIVSITGLSGG